MPNQENYICYFAVSKISWEHRNIIILILGWSEGYQSSTLKPAGKNGKLTAPVGFVTFESREQAEEAMTKLQGVKFDPEGNQHMRLEFARTNTKVTKPKFPSPGGPVACFTNLSPAVSAVQGLGPAVHLSGCANGFAANNLQGLVAGLPPALFSQLANTSAFDPSAIFASPDATIAAAAAAAQWSPISGNSSIGTAYDNATYLASAAGLLQANNFRTIIPGNLGSGGFGLNTSSTPSLQLVQAAIAQANAVAALGATNPHLSGTPVLPMSPGQQQQQQQQTQQLSPIAQCTTATSCSPTAVSHSSPISSARITPLTISTSGFTSAMSNSAQAQMNSLMVQLQQQQQQQQAFAAAQQQQQKQQQQQHQAQHSSPLASHASQQPPSHLQSSLGYASSSSTAAFPPQVNAATIGLLGGYNSLVKELTGGETHLSVYQPHQNLNF